MEDYVTLDDVGKASRCRVQLYEAGLSHQDVVRGLEQIMYYVCELTDLHLAPAYPYGRRLASKEANV